MVRQFETTDFLRDGTSKSAAFMAEKFAFEKAAGDGGTVQLDESAIAARAEAMDGAGDELLASAGFAEDQDGSVGQGDIFDLP